MPPVSRDGTIKLEDRPEIEREHRVLPPVRRRTNPDPRNVLVTTDEVIEEEFVEAVEDLFTGDEFVLGEVGDVEGIGTEPAIEPEPVKEPPFLDVAEVMPQYEGGLEAMMKFIQKKIRYPSGPKRQQIDGTVYVRFVVNGDGSVSNVEVIKGVHPDYDKEAMRVISLLPAWKGGSHNGRPVGVRMVLPIKFRLQ
jgi:protein TonB